jgi:Flp pilus assembly protein TadB
MRATKAERRLRNLQTLLLLGAFLAALLAAVLLGLVGLPQPIAIAIGIVVYFASWRAILRAIRQRRAAREDTDNR